MSKVTIRTLLKEKKYAELVILNGVKNLAPLEQAPMLMVQDAYNQQIAKVSIYARDQILRCAQNGRYGHPGMLQQSEILHSVQNDKGWLGSFPLTYSVR